MEADQVRLAVTGASGFLGRALLDNVLADFPSVQLQLLEHSTSLPEHACSRATVVRGDVRDPSQQVRLVRGADVIVHLSAFTGVPRGRAEVDRMYSTNVEATRTLVRAVQSYSGGRLVFLSSAAVYGNRTFGRVSEAVASAPDSCYGETKRAAEMIIESSGLDYAIVRPTVVFGENHPRRYLHRLMRAVSKRWVPELSGAWVNLVYSRDVATSLLRLILRPGEIRSAMNLNNPLESAELVRIVAAALKVESCPYKLPTSLIRLLGTSMDWLAAGELHCVRELSSRVQFLTSRYRVVSDRLGYWLPTFPEWGVRKGLEAIAREYSGRTSGARVGTP